MREPVHMLTVEPIAGLGNRMRVVGSAIALAHAAGARLRIVWTRTTDLHSRFDALFEPLPDVHVVERSWTGLRMARHYEVHLGRYDRAIYQPEVERLMAERADFPALVRKDRLLVVTCSRFFEAPALLTPLVPVRSILREVDVVAAGFEGRETGVHIRRTDHAFRHLSPTAMFLERMRAEIESDPATRFFLATDDAAEEARMREIFGNRILTRPKRFERTQPEGIRDALIDLLCLARTRRVIASVYSSFSEAAAEMGGVELVAIDNSI